MTMRGRCSLAEICADYCRLFFLTAIYLKNTFACTKYDSFSTHARATKMHVLPRCAYMCLHLPKLIRKLPP